MSEKLKAAATIGRVGLALTAGQMVALGVIAVVVVGAIYYYTSGTGKPRRVVNYPQEIYLVHTDQYWVPGRNQWSNDFSVFGANRWFFSKVRPNAQGHIQVNFGKSMLAHADQVFAFRSNQQLCPKVYELKLKLDAKLLQEYACD